MKSKIKHITFLIAGILILNLNGYSRVVATRICNEYNGTITSIENNAFEFNTRVAGNYNVQCQVVAPAPYSYSSFQGSINTIVQNPNTTVTNFFNSFTNYQFGYSLFISNNLPPQCSKYIIKYKITTMSGTTELDWTEIEIVRNDYFNVNPTNEAQFLNTPELFLQDDIKDLGYEVNNATKSFTASKDIWNRQDNSVSIYHLNPMHSIQTPVPNTNYLNYTIRNRSCANTPTSNLRLYWTIARMHEYWAHDWKNYSRGTHYADNKVVYSGSDKPLGNEITITDPFDYGSSESAITIPSIAGGSTYTSRKSWLVPNPDWAKNGSYSGQYPIQFSSANSNPVICLLARLDEPWKTNNGYPVNPSETDKTDIVYYAKENNNVVTKNSFILNSLDGYIWQPAIGNPRSRSGEIIVNPPTGANPDPINIGIIRDTLAYDSLTPPDFTQHGQVNLYLDILLWNRWVDGGMAGENIEVIDDQFIKVTNSNFAKLGNIQLYEGEISKIAVETEYFEANPPETDYDYSFAFGSLNSTNTLLGSPTIFEATVLSTPIIKIIVENI